jgi:hypothetical protein
MAGAAKAVGKTLAEVLAPTPNGLVGDHNAPLSKAPLDVAQAGGKAMAAVRVGWWLHAASLAGPHPNYQMRLPR